MDAYKYRVEFADRPSNWSGVLDMLRYDRAIVRDWTYLSESKRWLIRFSTDAPATEARWLSFCLRAIKEH